MNLLRRLRTPGVLSAGSVPFDLSRPLAFMHIPKTSGMSVTQGLTMALTPAVVVTGYDHSLFDSDQDFDSIDESIRCQIYASCASMPKHADLVAGHFAMSTLIRAYPIAQRLTLLREPLSRLLSHWMYWRTLTDANLALFGNRANRMRIAREPLADFLSERILACSTDNVTVRMLLWPHPLIEAKQFIDPAHDRHLLRAAMARLMEFHFVDVIENDALVDRLQCWLGRPFNHGRLNETSMIPQEFRSRLQDEITPRAHELLCARSRLDLRIWAEVAAHRLPGRDVSKLREQTILANASRYSVLLA